MEVAFILMLTVIVFFSPALSSFLHFPFYLTMSGNEIQEEINEKGSCVQVKKIQIIFHVLF